MTCDFSSSHQTLAKEMMDDIETLEKVLRSAAYGSDDSIKALNLLRRLKTCYDHCSMEEAIKAVKNCHQLGEAQQVISILFFSCIICFIISIWFQILNDLLKTMREEILKVKTIFSSNDSLQSSNLTAPYVNKTTTPDLVQNVHQQPENHPVVVKKFRTKFDPLKLKSGSLKYASVFINKALQPGEIYVRFDDDDMPRYKQMQRELQKEFSSATRRSTSYRPSPISGLL